MIRCIVNDIVKISGLAPMWRYFAIVCMVFQTVVVGAFAQKPQVKFRARGLFDLGYFSSDEYKDKAYVAIDDLRLGAKVTQGRLEFKMDVGIVAKQISVKDMIIEYRFPDSRLTFGNAYEPFSMDAMISSMDFRFASSSSAVQAVAAGRRLGFTYHICRPKYYGAVGVYSDNNLNDLFDNSKYSTALASTTRHAYRNMQGEDFLIQASGAFSVRTLDQSPGKSNVDIISAGFSPVWGKDIVWLRVENAKLNLKSNLEFLAYHKRFMVQAEILGAYIIRKYDLPNYMVWGGYVQMSVLLNRAGRYGYDQELAIMTRPSKGSMELTSRIDHLDANHPRSGLMGGKHTDISLGFNYFFHQNVSAKINVNYSLTDQYVNSVFIPNTWMSTVRLQFYF